MGGVRGRRSRLLLLGGLAGQKAALDLPRPLDDNVPPGINVDTLPVPQIVALVRPENQPSQQVLTKLGFTYIHNAYHYGFDVQCWRLLAAEFSAQMADEALGRDQ